MYIQGSRSSFGHPSKGFVPSSVDLVFEEGWVGAT